MMLAYRPLLVVCALYRHNLSTNRQSSKAPSAASPHVILASQQASERALTAARHIVSVVENFIDIDANAKVRIEHNRLNIKAYADMVHI
jgi:hypothetical protein